jgi:NDP-sugar pyrophosphorylase family protein
MQAIILAGGKGVRLKPFTVAFPKPLMPIDGYPIMEVVIRQLAYYGFNNITISTGYLSELIEAFFQTGKKWGVKIEYIRENIPLNTAGALNLIDELEDSFLVINGDTLTKMDFKKLLDYHLCKKAYATVAVTSRETKIDFGVVKVDKDFHLLEYNEKPVYKFMVSMGVYVLSKACVNYIKVNESISMPDLLLRIQEDKKRISCYLDNTYWLDIGRIDDYDKAQEEFKKNEFVIKNE